MSDGSVSRETDQPEDAAGPSGTEGVAGTSDVGGVGSLDEGRERDRAREDRTNQVPQPPPEAERVAGDRLPELVSYARLLADEGVRRGMIGPREVDRLWERHLLNCAVVEAGVPSDAQVCDVGSGAGLPGVVLGLLRPDLHITLLEPMLRRTTFLAETVDRLGIADRVRIERGRSEEGTSTFDVVIARAVAPLDRLAPKTLPRCRPGGVLLAMKGRGATAELEAAEPTLRRFHAASWSVERYGAGVVDPPTTVVRVVAGTTKRGRRPGNGSRRRR